MNLIFSDVNCLFKFWMSSGGEKEPTEDPREAHRNLIKHEKCNGVIDRSAKGINIQILISSRVGHMNLEKSWPRRGRTRERENERK